MPKFLQPIDLSDLEIRNVRLQNLSAAPSTNPGQVYYDTDDNRAYYWNATSWTAMDGGLAVGSVTSSHILDGTILNADINAAAAIAVTKLASSATDRLFGRDTAAAGAGEEITVGGGIEFTGTAGIQTSAFTGDVTKTAGGTTLTIPSNTVTFAKMQDITTDRLLGRDTAATGDPEELTVGGGLEFTGTGGIQTGAFTGDVTKTAGGTALTIAANAVVTAKILDANVTLAKLANIATDSLIGRDTAASGVPEIITLDTTLAMNGSQVLGRAALTGDVTASAASNATTIANNAVTNAKAADMAANSFKGNNTGAPADPLDLTVAQAKTLLAIATADISDYATATVERAQDAVGALIGAGGIVVTYDDAGTGLTTLTMTNNEAFQDALAPFFASGAGSSGIVVTYDDVGNKMNYVVGAVAPAGITFAATDKLLGRDTAAGGPGEEIGVAGGIVFDGAGNIQTTAFTGDVTKTLGGTALTIATNAVVTAKILDANVTLAKLANIATDSLIGRDTAGTGVPENILLNATLAMDGAGNLQRAALTGDVTASAGSNATTVANDAVTNAKLANMATLTIKGNNTGGSADPLDLTAAQVKTLLAIVPGDVTGFDTQVRTNRLDQMATPTASVAWGAQKITGLLDPTLPQDAATKAYVDATATGLEVKGSVRAASTATVTVTYNATGGASGRGQMTAMPNVIDGVTLAANNRVLLKDQAAPAQDGIWVVTTLGTGANGVWDRATDFDQDAEVLAGAFTFVEEGTVNQDSGWVLTTNNPITIGGASGTSLAFAQFSGAGQITAGTGMLKTGNTLDVGAGLGISVAADTVLIDVAVVTRKYAASVGDGSTLAYVVTHNLNTQDVVVAVRDNSSPYAYMLPDIEATSVNTVTVRFAVAPTTNQYRVVVHA